jgi:ABC-type iron transport system FetAB ATPase subunit
VTRMYEPSAGEIFIGGTPLSAIPKPYLRKKVSYVTQVRDVRKDDARGSMSGTLMGPMTCSPRSQRPVQVVKGLMRWREVTTIREPLSLVTV